MISVIGCSLEGFTEKLLTVNDIKLWVDKGKSSLIKGMKSKAGKSFDAFIVLNDAGETSFEFDN